MCFNILKNCVLSPSPLAYLWLLQFKEQPQAAPNACCSLSSVCASVKSQATAISKSPRVLGDYRKAIRKCHYTLQTMEQRGRKNMFYDPNKCEVTNLQLLYRQMAKFHQEQTRSNQYFWVCSRQMQNVQLEGLSAANGKVQSSVEEISSKPSALTTTYYYQNKN